jgi:LysR family transcriptional regulator, mexEF-oprN operon transcriptional activator
MTTGVRAYGLGSIEVPFKIAPLPHAMVGCSGRSRDPGLGWLRSRFRPMIKSYFQAITPARRPG